MALRMLPTSPQSLFRYHPLAWISWLVATCVALSATRNPLHLLIVVLCITFTMQRCAPQPGVLRLLLLLLVSTAIINLLIARTGSTMLLVLPITWPLIGGTFTLESLVYGLLTGLALAGLLLAFRVAHQGIPTRALLDLLPNAFAPLAVTLAISIAFVPATLRHLRQIRDAQAVRGHRLRGLRDWLAILVPLLIGGLDRALQLAETLTARGFPEQVPQRYSTGIILAGLALLLTGFLLNAWDSSVLAAAMIAAGFGMVLAVIWQVSRASQRTRYRHTPWFAHDTLIACGALISVLAFVVPFAGMQTTALVFSPYPTLQLPDFSPWIGVATLGLVLPGVGSPFVIHHSRL
jgi:energy-coupling factor transport system permease protein